MLDGPDEGDPDATESVFSEKSPHEPEEFDPDSLGPDIPEAPSAPDGSAASDTAALFWKLVVVFNVALLALSVGPMFIFFEGNTDLGLRIFLVGLVAFGYGTFRYVRFRQSRERSEEDDGSSDATADDADDAATDHNG
ncbi:DUF7322 domain-containing protein [Haloarcula nitratireducens]|uniref:DUF7322 domain-containing protein n=1 Tax=Haloarcula nitratireducens TaxID=2487749 RepID=A0AAW4P673_9EURY|nr:hypothetical protein [Halomicroarcula nitratireducens]MBX0293481.1 hypothetical protein [Halomicroarcula nitratireducens]